jgi:hypothetical protein
MSVHGLSGAAEVAVRPSLQTARRIPVGPKEVSVRPVSADPTLVRTRHLSLCWLGEVVAIKTLSATTQSTKALQVLLSRHIAPISGRLARSRRGNAVLRSPTGADAAEESVLDVRNHSDNRRRRRAYRQGSFAQARR